MSLILGIDPGLNITGWGIIRADGNYLSHIASGKITVPATLPLAERLLKLHDGVAHVVALYHPDEAAIEETFMNKNAMSSLKLGHARGALMLSLSLAKLSVFEYAATLVKKSIVGVGRAEKDQVAMMVRAILPGSQAGSPDAADALAVAICHANHRTVRKLSLASNQ